MGTQKKIYIVYSIAACLVVMNLMGWLHTNSIHVEVENKSTRSPASIGLTTKSFKKFQFSWVQADCQKNQNIEVKDTHFRIKMKSCGEIPTIKNATNRFQASLWEEDGFWYSDYIPLEKNQNSIEIVFPGKIDAKQLQITRQVASDDAK